MRAPRPREAESPWHCVVVDLSTFSFLASLLADLVPDSIKAAAISSAKMRLPRPAYINFGEWDAATIGSVAAGTRLASSCSTNSTQLE